MLRIRDTGGVVSKYPVIPTVMRQQAVTRGQINPLLPLLVAYHILDTDCCCRLDHIKFLSLKNCNLAQWRHNAQGSVIPFLINFDYG